MTRALSASSSPSPYATDVIPQPMAAGVLGINRTIFFAPVFSASHESVFTRSNGDYDRLARKRGRDFGNNRFVHLRFDGQNNHLGFCRIAIVRSHIDTEFLMNGIRAFSAYARKR